MFTCGRVPVIVHVYACDKCLYFTSCIYNILVMYFLLLYTMRGRPFVVVSLRAPYLASGSFQLSGFLLGLWPLSASGLLHSTIV